MCSLTHLRMDAFKRVLMLLNNNNFIDGGSGDVVFSSVGRVVVECTFR